MEAVECGAAALGSILAYHGRFVPIEKLRVLCGVSRDGSKASSILRGARHFGMTAKGYKKEPEELRQMPLPLIIFWNFNHFLVVEGFGRKRVYLNDPATGPRTVSPEEFDEAFTGIALTFVKGLDFRPGGSTHSIIGALHRRLAGSRIALVQLILITLSLVVPGSLLPAFTRVYADQFLIQGRTSWLSPLLTAMFATGLVQALLTYLQQETLLRLEVKLAVSASARFVWHVFQLPIEFYAQRFSGEIGSRIETNNTLATLLSGDLATNAVNILLIVFYATLMIQYDTTMTLIVVAGAAANLLVLQYVKRRRVDSNRKLMQERGKLFGTATSGLQMIETLKSSGSESHFFSRWAGYQAKVTNAEQDLGTSSLLVSSLPPFIGTIAAISVLYIGGNRVMAGVLTIGGLLAFQVLMTSFMDPINRFIDLGAKLQQAEADLGRLDDVLKYEVSVNAHTEAPLSCSGDGELLEGYLELKNITFGYSPLEPPLVDNFSLSLRPGSRVAIVGGSGSGKSTVAKIACGLYQPWSGDIMYDGRARDSFPKSVLNNSIAFVDQDILLFEGTVRDNLSLWDGTIPEGTIVAAAKDGCIHDDISSRMGRYDGLIFEGARNFSGGQRQRLEIARALGVNPRILVLDEATSALDPVVEKQIDDNIRRRGCTCLIVAHRLSTIRDCDEIVVMQKGRIVERGDHSTLVRRRGMYAELIRGC
jgi:NHLM bacteriocin system ABC transporter peptidase/ATP-binding protein